MFLMFFGLLFTNIVIYNLLCPLLLQEMGPKQYIHDGRPVSRRTYYRRRVESNDDTSSEDAASPLQPPRTLAMVPSPSSSSLPSSPSNNAFSMLLGEDSPSSGEHGNLSTSLSPTSLASSSDGFQYDIIDMWTAIGFTNGEILACIPQQVDLAHTIEEKVISIQGLLDASNVPITIQGKIFEQVFQKKEEHQHQHPFDYDGMGMIQLIALSGVLLSYICEILELEF